MFQIDESANIKNNNNESELGKTDLTIFCFSAIFIVMWKKLQTISKNHPRVNGVIFIWK